MPFAFDGIEVSVTASIGLTIYPLDEADGDTLLRHADQAMYQAKQQGRNRYHLFDVHEDRKASGKREILEALGATLRNDELALYYQPKADMRKGSVIGVEALLRWHHPQKGVVLPNEFLPAVESSGLIVELGEWVIEAALRQLEIWLDEGAVWPVSVNISPFHFAREDFVPRLERLLARHPRVTPRLLELEIVETSALQNLAFARKQIEACRALGVSFALDDFGTGYSSLIYLKHLSFSTLKIDQSFVRDLLQDEQDLILIEAVVDLARRFSLSVVAEGVETQEHAILLIRLGCDLGQGYGIARPMPAAEAARWARAYTGDAEVMRWATPQWSLNDLPLLVAKHDHAQWVDRVLLLAEGAASGLHEEEIIDSHLCRFGRWYYGVGRSAWGDLPEFAAIEAVHDEVHRIGKEIVRLVRGDETAAARQAAQRLLALREEIFRLLDNLRARLLNRLTPS